MSSDNPTAALTLPFSLRHDFSRPRGYIVKGDFTSYLDLSAPSITCIGDVVSSYCLKIAKKYAGLLLLLIDGKTKRSSKIEIPKVNEQFQRIIIENPRSTISIKALNLLCNLLKNPNSSRYLILVKGEEDMLALPSIACTRPNGIVTYGVPDRGATIIKVNKWISWEAQSRFLHLPHRILLDKSIQ